MRKFVFPFLLGVVVTSGLAFKTVYEIKKDSAVVYEFPKYKGLCVFTDSEPLMPHDTIGKVSVGSLYTSQYYTDIRDKLLKKCNETYPKADGIIYQLKNHDGHDAWVIQFKK